MEKDLNDNIDQNDLPEQASFTIVSVPSDCFQEGQIPWSNLPSTNLTLQTVSGLEQYDIPQRVVVETLIPFSEDTVNSTLIQLKEDAASVESNTISNGETTFEGIAANLHERKYDQVLHEQGEIFSHLTGLLSSSVMQAIPHNNQTFLDNLQSKYKIAVNMTTEGASVSGSFIALTHLEKALRHLLDSEYTHKECNVDLNASCHKETLIKPDMVDKGISCNLLLPQISLHGREVRQHPRYINYVNSLYSSTHEDQKQTSIKKRKVGRPRKQLLAPKDNIKPKTDAQTQQTLCSNETFEKGTESNENIPDTVSLDCGQQPENFSFEEDLLNSQENINKEVQTKDDSSQKIFINKSKRSTFTGRRILKKNYEALAPFKFFCSECSFKSKRESHFIKHIKLHEKDNNLFRCKQCDFTSIRLSHLRRHEVLHSNALLQCMKCKYSTDSNKLLARHVKNRHNTQRKHHTLLYACPKCQYKTLRRHLYCSHLRLSHNETVTNDNSGNILTKLTKTYQCDLCSYKTQRKEHYVRHRNNVHCNQRPYLCDLCGKAFKRPDALAQHKFTHLDKSARVLPFTCTLCTKAFRSQAHLNEHMTMHSNIRAHLCHYCGASFKTRSVQQKHIQSIHVNPRSYNCSLCDKRFNTNYALMRHKRTHDGSDVQCVLPHIESHDSCSNLQQVSVQSFTNDASTCQEHEVLVQEVMAASPIGVTYDQNGDNIQQPLVQTNETTAALLYLTNNLPPY
ncbi:zinc finger protein 665 [Octopus bimaculoides]|uniref:C2H2-type domain-containing protein n=1 Tax=Octopus bimaculoides TaxID=37653 RepID=A0A0L8I3F1_OCTBM|nr:zinc finger protein 665 [Octopus bimaculoides]|eukprot:XP_014791275.1 PREDICTED: zinc finger protein 665-like [Octopus bimaculoides]